MKQPNLITSISIMAFALAFSSCSKQSGANQTDEIKTYPVQIIEPQNVELQTVFPAVIKGQKDIDIKPRVDGYIDKVLVDEGSVVKKGQPLFKINSPSSIQALEAAQSNYNTAKINVDRTRPLAEKGIVSNTTLENYQYALASAKATLDQAKATMSWTTVTSPVSGFVGTIDYREGSLVSNTIVLTTVSDISNVVAYFSLNEKKLLTLLKNSPGESQAEKIKNMAPVRLLLSDGTEYAEKGKIETISGVVDETSGSVNFRALFANKQNLLRSGSSAKVIIPEHQEGAIVIPQKATFQQQDKVFIFKCQGDSVVQSTIDVTSTPDGQDYVVTNGLSMGDKIVTDGIVSLSNGQKIKQKVVNQ